MSRNESNRNEPASGSDHEGSSGPDFTIVDTPLSESIVSAITETDITDGISDIHVSENESTDGMSDTHVSENEITDGTPDIHVSDYEITDGMSDVHISETAVARRIDEYDVDFE